MQTEVVKIEARPGEQSDAARTSAAVRRGAEVLRGGGLVVFPTETVYGLAARADSAEAVNRLRQTKSRESDRAFTLHIGLPEDARRYAPELSGLAARLIRKAWPGPLTLIVPVSDPASAPAMQGLNGFAAATIYHDGRVGFRCPEDPVAAMILQQVAAPVVATSANLAGAPPAWVASDALKALGGTVDLLIDGGKTKYAKASTIVQVTGSSYKLVREGVLDAGIIQRLSRVEVLLVCTGNTCRSPMAAAIAKKLLAERLGCRPDELPQRGIEVRSAGTAGGFGGASANAVKAMARRGLDLIGHVSVALTPQLVRQADYIFGMTRTHCDAIVAMVPSAAGRVALLHGSDEIHDPVGGADDEYERCVSTVEAGVSARIAEMIL